jgi:hypothetical protein
MGMFYDPYAAIVSNLYDVSLGTACDVNSVASTYPRCVDVKAA